MTCGVPSLRRPIPYLTNSLFIRTCPVSCTIIMRELTSSSFQNLSHCTQTFLSIAIQSPPLVGSFKRRKQIISIERECPQVLVHAHTRSSWWFLPTGEQSSAQERPVANRRARRAHTSRYARTSPSMWVSDRATRSGGKRRGRASGCFSPGLARLEPAITTRWVDF